MADGAETTWIQVAVEGSWDGHPMGAFEFTPDVFASILRNFDAQSNPVPLTYEHPDKSSGQPIPAAGWIHSLEVRGEALWAEVEFTKRSAEMVRAGEYKYCSVVVWFDSEDRATGDDIGPELLEVGLTNTPFLDGMEPITLSRALGKEQTMMKTAGLRALMNELTPAKDALDELKAKLGLDPDAEHDDIVDAIYKLLEMAGMSDTLDALAGDAAPAPAAAASDAPEGEVIAAADASPADAAPADAPAPTDQALATDAMAAIDLIAQAMGADAAGAIAALGERADEVAALLMAQPDGTAADAQMAQASATVATLSRQVRERDAELDELRETVTTLELTHRLDAAVSAGQVVEAERDFLLRLGRSDRALFDERLAAAEKRPAVPQAVTNRSVSDEVEHGQRFDIRSASRGQVFAYNAAMRAGLSEERATEIALNTDKN